MAGALTISSDCSCPQCVGTVPMLGHPELMAYLPAASELPFPRSPSRFEVIIFLYATGAFTFVVLTWPVGSRPIPNLRSSMSSCHPYV